MYKFRKAPHFVTQTISYLQQNDKSSSYLPASHSITETDHPETLNISELLNPKMRFKVRNVFAKSRYCRWNIELNSRYPTQKAGQTRVPLSMNPACLNDDVLKVFSTEFSYSRQMSLKSYDTLINTSLEQVEILYVIIVPQCSKQVYKSF